MFTVYFLYSGKYKQLYIGQTNNIEKRLKEHLSNKCFSTKNKQPLFLIYTENYSTRSEAMDRERYFKSLAGSKIKNKILQNFLQTARLN